MFLEEDDFNDNERGTATATAATATSLSSGDQPAQQFGAEFGAAGGLGGTSGGKARMLAERREIEMKRRQAALHSTGMVRSTADSSRPSSSAGSSNSSFTPAPRLFSAPKSLSRDADTEFKKEVSSSSNTPMKKRSDALGESASFTGTPTPNRVTSSGSMRRYDDDSDDDYVPMDKRGSGGAGGLRSSGATPDKSGNRLYDDDDDDDDDDDGEGAVGATKKNSADSNRALAREREEAILRAIEGASAKPSVPTALNLSNMRDFLTSPVPRSAGTVLCYIKRNKSGTNRLFPLYTLWLKDGDRFLMQSKKRSNNKTSNYLISMGSAAADLDKTSSNYLGKLRSNFMGTEFQIFDQGVSPVDLDPADPRVRTELAAVTYAANVLGSRGPRKMQVTVPAVDENNRPVARASGGGADDLLSRMRERNMRDLVLLINKPPRWNEQIGAYVLNFNGRVTMASVKNFQLVDPEEQNTVVLQFGRVAKDEFTMDLQWPLSPLQAFAITLSSFDSKIACD